MTGSPRVAGRDALLGHTKRRYKPVPIGGQVYRIRSLTEGEKSDYETETLGKGGRVRSDRVADAKRRLLVLVLVDDAGDRLFRDDEAHLLRQLDGAVTSALYDQAREHCGFEEGDIEALAGNSAEIDVDGSPTG